jgi:hypothetical protein
VVVASVTVVLAPIAPAIAQPAHTLPPGAGKVEAFLNVHFDGCTSDVDPVACESTVSATGAMTGWARGWLVVSVDIREGSHVQGKGDKTCLNSTSCTHQGPDVKILWTPTKPNTGPTVCAEAVGVRYDEPGATRAEDQYCWTVGPAAGPVA